MATGKITDLTSLPTANRATNVLEVVDVGGNASYKATPNFILGLSGNPVGDTDSQTLTNKTLTGPAISGPVLSGTVTGTYTLGGTPTFPASVVTLTGSQTLINKVLTSPTISSPTITNASITADAITGFTVANNGTIYGMAITSGQHSGTAITNNTIDASKIKWSATGANAGIWWEELARVTAGSTVTSITTPSFATRKYLRFQFIYILAGSLAAGRLQFNGDTANNYTYRISSNGGADGTGTVAGIVTDTGSAVSTITYGCIDVFNIATSEKLAQGAVTDSGSAAGVANTVNRREVTGKWANTAAAISSATLNASTAVIGSGSELVVLGHD